MKSLATVSIACATAVVAMLALGPRVAGQSLTYTRGQNVAPAYEGWEQDPDGSRWFVFGYMNRNWVEELNIPPGPDNSILPGGPDQGQPAHFLPRRNRFVFRVPVPKNFTEKDELIWTLTAHGTTEKAWASVRADYLLDNVVKASETGALGAGTSSPEVRANKPPVVKLQGDHRRTVRAGEPLTLTAMVTDDGIPKRRAAGLAGSAVSNPGSRRDAAGTEAGAENPQRINRALQPPSRVTVGKNVGLHLSWFVYRGSGKVTFNPPQIKSWEDTRTGANSPWAPIWIAPEMPPDGKVTVTATFAEPGTYVLHGVADDGALTGGDDVTVTVTGSSTRE